MGVYGYLLYICVFWFISFSLGCFCVRHSNTKDPTDAKTATVLAILSALAGFGLLVVKV